MALANAARTSKRLKPKVFSAVGLRRLMRAAADEKSKVLTMVNYGERLTVRRTATVTRAGRLERAWTKLIAHLELTELYEVSFSERRKL